MTLPTPVIEDHGRFQIVRDDLHLGGTKQVVLREYLPELAHKEFVYVAASFGKGGAALAYTCAELGFQATLFMARTPFQPDWIAQAQSLGTKIVWTELLPVKMIEDMAWAYAVERDVHYLPLGFDAARFGEILRDYARLLPITPQEIWCPVISGTLCWSLEAAFPKTQINGVSVVKHSGYKGAATLYQASEKFVRQAAVPPPYPSWPYSDAKVWRIAQKHGQDGAVIWNSNS